MWTNKQSRTCTAASSLGCVGSRGGAQKSTKWHMYPNGVCDEASWSRLKSPTNTAAALQLTRECERLRERYSENKHCANLYRANTAQNGSPSPHMNSQDQGIPAVPVGSAELNQGPTAVPDSNITIGGAVPQMRPINNNNNATLKKNTKRKKNPKNLYICTWNARTLSEESHMSNLLQEIRHLMARFGLKCSQKNG